MNTSLTQRLFPCLVIAFMALALLHLPGEASAQVISTSQRCKRVSGRSVVVEGRGDAPRSAVSQGQSTAMARRAATVDAQRQLVVVQVPRYVRDSGGCYSSCNSYSRPRYVSDDGNFVRNGVRPAAWNYPARATSGVTTQTRVSGYTGPYRAAGSYPTAGGGYRVRLAQP